MNCKYCGREFAYKGKKLFCNSSCWKKFQRSKNIRHCIICGKPFERKQGGKRFCSEECKDAKRRLDYAIAKKKEAAHKAIGKNVYDKQFNSNIDICLRCKNEDCKGTCEKINEFIKG